MKSKKGKKYNKVKNFITKDKIIKIILFLVTLIILLYLGVSLFNKVFEEKSIDINGLEKLNNLDINTYDVKALSLDLTNDEITAAPTSYNSEDNLVIYNVYIITKHTHFYKRVVNNTVNKDGETFSTIDYEVITRSELKEILDNDKEGILTYFWTDASNKCLDILISYE